MRRIPTTSLRPGMVVARGVYGSSGQILLQRGVILTSRYISQLKDLRVPSLYVDDGLLDDFVVDDVVREHTRANAVQLVKQLLTESERPTSKQSVILRTAQMARIVDNITDELLNQKDLIVNLIDIRLEDDYLFGHSVNVCVLALITGISRKMSRDSLVQLGLGAMLHDLGKVGIPKHILDKPGSLSKDEFEIVKTHSSKGFEMLSDIPAARDIAHEHHERYDGSGYPMQKKGREISFHAQIAAISDVFDAVTADRVYRPAHSIHEAYELVAASGNQAFDLRLVKNFLDNIAAYPTGTIVELSDGRVGVCMETPPGLSLLPKVRVLYDQERRPIKAPDEIELSTQLTCTIRRVMNEQEIAALRDSSAS